MSDTTAMEAADTPVIQIDGFVKAVLVVIAIILGVMIANHAAKQPRAEAPRCGDISKPCYIRKL